MSKEELLELLNLTGYNLSGILNELRYYNIRRERDKLSDVLENKLRPIIEDIADILNEEEVD